MPENKLEEILDGESRSCLPRLPGITYLCGSLQVSLSGFFLAMMSAVIRADSEFAATRFDIGFRMWPFTRRALSFQTNRISGEAYRI